MRDISYGLTHLKKVTRSIVILLKQNKTVVREREDRK